MASIHWEMLIDVPVAKAWAALRDVGAPHRLFAGVLTKSSLAGDTRTVTFANGMEVRERIVDVDEVAHRVAYSVQGNGFDHHHATMQIVPAGKDRCRFVWTSDFLPAEKTATVEPLVAQGSLAMKRVLEG